MEREPILSLQGVAKSYGETEVLAGIDLEVMEGEFVAILGFSGAGKTTLISIVAGLVEPDRGAVLCAARRSTGPTASGGWCSSPIRCSPG
jgi:nitrate/nitrite transport system ATP-binding protein